MHIRKLKFGKVVCLSVAQIVNNKTHTCVFGFQPQPPKEVMRYVQQSYHLLLQLQQNSPQTGQVGDSGKEWKTKWFLQQFNDEQGQEERKLSQIELQTFFELFIDYVSCKSTVPKAHTSLVNNFRKRQGC